MESILKHFLTKNGFDIVAKNDIPSMYTTLGIRRDLWISMYNKYIIAKDNSALPYDVEFINVLEVLLYRHSFRDW